MSPVFPEEKIEGDRIVLRRHGPAHAGILFSALESDRRRLGEFVPLARKVLRPEDAEEWVRQVFLLWQEGRRFEYGIFRKEDGSFLGHIMAHSISWEDERLELGYWLLGAAEGKGYVSESLLLLEKEFFRIGFHRLEIHCDKANAKSAHVPQRAGFTLEGVLKDFEIVDGKRRDSMVWAMLKSRRSVH